MACWIPLDPGGRFFIIVFSPPCCELILLVQHDEPAELPRCPHILDHKGLHWLKGDSGCFTSFDDARIWHLFASSLWASLESGEELGSLFGHLSNQPALKAKAVILQGANLAPVKAKSVEPTCSSENADTPPSKLEASFNLSLTMTSPARGKASGLKPCESVKHSSSVGDESRTLSHEIRYPKNDKHDQQNATRDTRETSKMNLKKNIRPTYFPNENTAGISKNNQKSPAFTLTLK